MTAPVPTPAELAERLTFVDFAERIVGLEYDVTQEGRSDLALLLLAYLHGLALLAVADRWAYVVEAGAAGATVRTVATACGLEPDEIVFGLRMWADEEQRAGRLSDAQVTAVAHLAGGEGR